MEFIYHYWTNLWFFCLLQMSVAFEGFFIHDYINKIVFVHGLKDCVLSNRRYMFAKKWIEIRFNGYIPLLHNKSIFIIYELNWFLVFFTPTCISIYEEIYFRKTFGFHENLVDSIPGLSDISIGNCILYLCISSFCGNNYALINAFVSAVSIFKIIDRTYCFSR